MVILSRVKGNNLVEPQKFQNTNEAKRIMELEFNRVMTYVPVCNIVQLKNYSRIIDRNGTRHEWRIDEI